MSTSLRAKRSNPESRTLGSGLLRRFAPRNDGLRSSTRPAEALRLGGSRGRTGKSIASTPTNRCSRMGSDMEPQQDKPQEAPQAKEPPFDPLAALGWVLAVMLSMVWILAAAFIGAYFMESEFPNRFTYAYV